MNYQSMISNSTLLYSQEVIDNAITNMAKVITEDLIDSEPIVLCVMNGGMLFTSALMQKLQFSVEFDSCRVSRYKNNDYGSRTDWIQKPSKDLNGRVVLICDDIYDEGHTLSAVIEHCQKQNTIVKTAVLFNKIKPNKLPLQIDYTGINIDDHFIFGYGLDYQGFFRNLPEIRYIEK